MPTMRISSILKLPFLSTRQLPRPRRHKTIDVAIAFAALLTWSVTFAAPSVSVTNARIRLLPGDLPLAGYFDLVNQGKEPLTFIGASSPAFKMVHMHLSMEHAGKSTMIKLEAIELNPGETLNFSPGGYHLMLMERVRPLHVGDKVPMTLQFSGQQSLPVMFEVRNAGTN
jgi:periplasmic copper chaperone A